MCLFSDLYKFIFSNQLFCFQVVTGYNFSSQQTIYMKKRNPKSAITGLIGHLSLKTSVEKKASLELTSLLTRTNLESGTEPNRPNPFSFEKSDLFQSDTISDSQKKAIQKIEEARKKKNPDTQFKVFRREVSLRDPLISQSVSDWSAGSKVDETVGPFKNKDGRQFWFDFLPIGAFTALYKQGITSPVLLFQERKSSGKASIKAREATRKLHQYNLGQGGVWINARLFSPNAPEGAFTGLSIKSGLIKMSHPTKTVNKKITLPANAKIEVELKLEQQEVKDINKKSPYGKAAAAMVLNLPATLDFNISGNTASISAIGRASWDLMGQKIGFSWQKNQSLSYHPLLKRILIPFQGSAKALNLQQNESDFNFLSNKALIENTGWLLPITQLDLLQPTFPEGTGQLYVRTGPGLVNSWAGLQGSGFNLSQTHLLAGPGQLLLVDFSVSNAHASQELELWKTEDQLVPSKVQLTFPQSGPLIYLSHANGNELLIRFCNTDFQVDRPVKVDGTPPLLQSRHSLLILSATPENRLVYLFDDNLIADTAEIENQDPYIPEQMALAMSNALFKVTQPNGCLLFGELDENFSKVSEGFLFLSFGLLAYIPTLPDPYAANLGLVRRQFREGENQPGGAGATLQGWLIGRTAWSAGDAGDQVTVSFHFSPLEQLFGGISLDQPEEEPGTNPATPGPANFSSIPGESAFVGSNFSDLENPGSRLSAMRFSGNLEQSNVIGSNDNTRLASSTSSTAPIRIPDYGSQWDKESSRYRRDVFALLDVSTNADLFGISFDLLNRREFQVDTERDPATGEIFYSFFSLQVQGLDVVSAGENVRAFTVPQISWEPVINLTPPLPPPDDPISGDPAAGFNYYPNDGGPTRIANNSEDKVVLAPLPLTDFLLEKRKNEENFKAFSFFTLPFGMKAAALLTENYRYNNVNREGG